MFLQGIRDEAILTNSRCKLTDLNAGFAILKLGKGDLAGRVSQPVADFINQSRVRSPGEDAGLTHLGWIFAGGKDWLLPRNHLKEKQAKQSERGE